MKFFRKNWPAIVLTTLLLASVAVSRPARTLSKEQISAKTASVVEKCREKTDTWDLKCAEAGFKKFVSGETLGSVMEALQEVLPSSCHIPAHIAGSAAFQNGVTFSQLMKTCPTQCGFGCLHGGFQEMFRQSSKNFLEDFPTVCLLLPNPTEEDLRSCWHITGHGLGEVYGENLEEAVKGCLKLATEEGRRFCVAGVRMEYLTGSPDNPGRLDSAAGDFTAFCNRFPGQFRNECFGEAAYYLFKFSGDTAGAARTCSGLPTDFETKKACAFGAGSAFVLIAKDPPEAVSDGCLKFGPNLFRNCLFGAIDIYATSEDEAEKGRVLCRLSGEKTAVECLSYLKERIEWWSGNH